MWLQSLYPSFFLLPSSFLLLLSRLLSDAAYPPDEISFWISIAVGVISGLRFLILPHSTPILSTETVLTLPRLPCELHLLLSTSCLPPEPIPPLAARQNVARTAPPPPSLDPRMGRSYSSRKLLECHAPRRNRRYLTRKTYWYLCVVCVSPSR